MPGEAALRVAIVTHYFPPEIGAAPSRLIELAQRLDDAGHRVTVLTGFPNYPTGVLPARYRGRLRMEDEVGGVRVLRGWIFAAPNRGFLRRVLNHLSLTVAVIVNVWKAERVDVIFVQSPPLFAGLAGLALRLFKRSPFVLNVSDIWPESAVQMGMLRNPVAIRMAEMLERYLYRRARRVTVATAGMLERLAGRGVPRDKLVVLRNGVDTEKYRPGVRERGLSTALGLDHDEQVFLYAGNHGMAQGLDVILEAARITTSPHIRFLLVGDGAEKAGLVARAKSQRLDNLRFAASLARDSMPALLNLAFAAIIPLRRLELFESAIPSKIFEAMAAGRPIIAPLWGEAAELVRAADCGIVVEPEDPVALSKAVTRLSSDPGLADRLGANGRAYVVGNFDRTEIAAQLARILEEAAGRAPT